MPRVPVYNQPQVQSRAAQFVPQSGAAATPDAFGAGIARAGQQLAATGMQAGDMMARDAIRQQTLDNEAAVKQVDTEFNAQLRALQFDPEKGFYGKRGKDALDALAPAQKQVEELRQTYLSGLGNEEQRRMFGDIATRRAEQALDSMTRHAAQERRTWLDTASQARIVDAVNDGAAFYNNVDRINQSLIVARNEILDQAERNGWDPAVTKLKLEQTQSDVHKQVIARRMVDDPIGAQTYFEAHKDRIVGADVDNLQRTLKTGVAKATADKIVSSISSGGAVGIDALWAATKQTESGGRQFDKDGKPLTSKAGAVGVGQVMPETGPEAAAAAGLPWDEQRFRNDATYNEALGKAYLQKQLAAFGNNRVLALAAYNAGPGAVSGWLKTIGDPRKGEISDAEFAAKIPYKETRNYVETVQRRAGMASAERPSLSAWLDQAGAIEDPDVRKQVESGLVTAFNRHEATIREAERRARDDVWKMAITPDVRTVADIPHDKWASLPGETQRSVMTYLENKAAGKTVTPTQENQEEYYRLVGMASQDPAAFADLKLDSYINRLPQSQWQQLVNAQASINRADVKEAAKTANVTRAMSLLKQEMVGAGLKPTSKHEKDAAEVAIFQGRLVEELTAAQDAKKGKLDDAEILDVGRRLLTKGTVPGGVWGSVWPSTTPLFKAIADGRLGEFTVPYASIPKTEIPALMEAGRKRLGRDPSQDEIAQAYTYITMKGRK